MSWNIADNKNLSLKLKTKLGLYQVELRSKLKDSPKKFTLTLVKLNSCQRLKELIQKMKFLV